MESEDEVEEEDVIAFSSSGRLFLSSCFCFDNSQPLLQIKPLTTTANTQPKTPKPPRRSKSGPSAPKAISSRAFLTTRVDHEEPRSSSPVAQAGATARPSPPAATVLSSPPREQLPCEFPL